MAATQKTDLSSQEIESLLKQNAALQMQVEQLRAEGESYRRTLQSWAKERITEEVVQGWMAEEKVEGSLLDFINQVKDESRSAE
jgi:molecular chaperone GrpE (heat shock protein)